MLSKLLSVAAAAVVACSAPMASATVLTFDDLGAGPDYFLADYAGFRFGTNDIADTTWFHTSEMSSLYKPSSGAGYIATDSQMYPGGLFDAAQAITNTTPFTFDGAWFSGGDQIRYQLYSGSNLVYTSADSTVLTDVPVFVASGYGGAVTGVVVLGPQGFYAMDDFTINTPVPEPETYALMLAGLAAIGGVVRRRTHVA